MTSWEKHNLEGSEGACKEEKACVFRKVSTERYSRHAMINI